jgi:hypothetical protein
MFHGTHETSLMEGIAKGPQHLSHICQLRQEVDVIDTGSGRRMAIRIGGSESKIDADKVPMSASSASSWKQGQR